MSGSIKNFEEKKVERMMEVDHNAFHGMHIMMLTNDVSLERADFCDFLYLMPKICFRN